MPNWNGKSPTVRVLWEYMSMQYTCACMNLCAHMHTHTTGGRREHSQAACAIWMAEWGQERKTFITCALLAHITRILGNGHGSTAPYNAKMQNLKSLSLGFNPVTQLFISENQASVWALYMLASFSTFMVEEQNLCNRTVPPVSDDKRLWKGTLRFSAQRLASSQSWEQTSSATALPILPQLTARFIHVSSTTNILWILADADTLPTASCNTTLSFISSKLKLFSSQD